jgi:hypothetical protein
MILGPLWSSGIPFDITEEQFQALIATTVAKTCEICDATDSVVIPTLVDGERVLLCDLCFQQVGRPTYFYRKSTRMPLPGRGQSKPKPVICPVCDSDLTSNPHRAPCLNVQP